MVGGTIPSGTFYFRDAKSKLATRIIRKLNEKARKSVKVQIGIDTFCLTKKDPEFCFWDPRDPPGPHLEHVGDTVASLLKVASQSCLARRPVLHHNAVRARSWT